MERPHVIVIPYPAQGHVLPMLELAQCLAERSITVTFVNTDFNHERVLRSLSDVKGAAEVRMVSVHDGVDRPSDREDLGKLTEGIFRAMPVGLEALVERLNGDGERVTCVIADGQLGWWAFEVAAKFGVKKAAFWPASAASVGSLLGIPKLVSDGIIDDKDGTILKKQIVQFAKGTPALHSTHFIWASVGDRPTQKIIYDMLSKIHISEKHADRCICNSSHVLEPGAFSAYPNITPVGPLLASNRLANSTGHFWPEDPACLAWLDCHPLRSVIYVAFGSLAMLDSDQLSELALGLELTRRPFLWVVRHDMADNGGVEEAFLEGFEKKVGERGRIVEWAPQQRVLCHPSIGCFVSHCGWNSTIEGVCGGVPFVCWPYFADQFLNESYICDEWEIGVRLCRDEANGAIIGRQEIKDKLELVSSDKGGHRGRAEDLRAKTLESFKRGKCHENFDEFIEWIRGL